MGKKSETKVGTANDLDLPKVETRIEYMDVETLTPWDRNPKKHDFDQIKASLKRFGFTAPVLFEETTSRIIAGHGRTEALIKLKNDGMPAPKRVTVREVEIDGKKVERWFVPVLRGLSFDSQEEANAYLIADNRIGEIGGWDDSMLKEMLEELRGSSDELSGVGFDLTELEVMVSEQDEERRRGPTPAEKLETYVTAPIKQIVMFLPAAEYDAVVDRLGRAMAHLGVKSHTEVIMKLLEALETQYPQEPEVAEEAT